jgi:hypothetical protein
MITKELSDAYYGTDYIIFMEDENLVLGALGQSARLESLMKEDGVSTCAYITAYSPDSKVVSPDENTRNQKALIADISSKHWKYYNGEGKHPSNNWPAEPSILIMGIKLKEARDLALRYRQIAFLFGTSGGKTKLIATNEKEQHKLEHPSPC